ncbi:MAG TPA: peptidyl-prolyl cis-trans isomerase [Gemmatimonadaceae bacterium]|jgi:peptidyl-prolyl cis-trans isomerase D
MLQQMRSLAKYVWLLVALAFVGGFLLYETSGLIGRTPITTTTAVAVVNGHELMYRDYIARVQNQMQTEQASAGRTLTPDDNRRIENSVFDAMVSETLLNDEYRKRRIVVSDDEIKDFARYAPPPWLQQEPSLQTDGRFDMAKYQRLLGSAQARQGGLLVQLEGYYRSEIPREKLFEQITGAVYASASELWRAWRDQHDSAQVSFVAFTPTPDDAAAKAISDGDLHTYFDAHKTEFQGPGRAVLSVMTIPRVVTAADTAAAKAKATALREEIVKGAKFEDVAKRESADTASGSQGGDLGAHGRGTYVPDFEKAAYALSAGQISEPVQSPFGFHIIRLDSKKGDTLSLHHILVRIQASDSTTTRIDREADRLTTIAAQGTSAHFDSASKALSLPVLRAIAFENEPAVAAGQVVPGASAWAFGGAKPGETSEMFDDDNGYYVARLDTLQEGGEPKFDNVKDLVRARVAAQRAVDKLLPEAQKVATAAASSTLEAAAQTAGKKVEQSQMFSRSSNVLGLGQFNEAIGAAFALPTAAVSQPIKTDNGVFVERVDKRIVADSAQWAAQKDAQKTIRLQQLRQQRIQMFLQDLRKSAKVDDRRKAINAAARRQEA